MDETYLYCIAGFARHRHHDVVGDGKGLSLVVLEGKE